MRVEMRFGLLFAEQERSGSAAEHVSRRRKKVERGEAKRLTEAGRPCGYLNECRS